MTLPPFVAAMVGCLTPNGLNSYEQLCRQLHDDLPSLDESALACELWAIRPLLYYLSPDHWLFSREHALLHELESRRRGATPPQRHVATAKVTPRLPTRALAESKKGVTIVSEDG